MKDSTLYLVRLGEISLKGLNRDFFEKRLKLNIKAKLRPHQSVVTKQRGRLYFEISNTCSEEQAIKAFKTTFGVVGFSKCIRCKKDIEVIKAQVAKLIQEEPFASGEGTFKSETRRADKNFPLNSYEIDCAIGGVVLRTYPNMRVNAKYPEKTIYCEIRDRAYLYTSPQPGPGGLPVNTAGKAMLLLSGGIDSPVSSYMMAQRGLKQECIYFHSPPYTSDQALEKVEKLTSLIAPYLQGTRLHVVPFTAVQLWIRDHSPEDEHTLMFRAAMMKVANTIAQVQDGEAIVTGEALSQVASQTLESMTFTDNMSERLVLRPLVGMDKEEIMKIAHSIGTYETSILPYEDCCIIFSPKHPLVRPNVRIVTEHYHAMEIEPLLQEAIDAVTTVDFDFEGNRKE